MNNNMNNSSNGKIQIRVLAASTGICYPISLHPNELTVANIRRHLAGTVPPQDQILLLGPPYKVPKDSTLRSEEVLASLRLGDLEDDSNYMDSQSDTDILNVSDNSSDGMEQKHSQHHQQSQEETPMTSTRNNDTPRRSQKQKHLLSTAERSGARRLFLFSKQALSDSAPDPPSCALHPMQVTLPTQPSTSPILLQNSSDPSSPLHQALSVYECRFSLHLSQGRTYADAADLRLLSCRTCISEQTVMARALRAAVSNLSDHRNAAARTRSEFTSFFQTKRAAHDQLLRGFENTLGKLGSIPLHPALISIARTNGRIMETLLDTVPVERMRAWMSQCLTSHTRLDNLFAELDASFAHLGDRASREREAKEDRDAEENIVSLWEEVEGVVRGLRDDQSERLVILTRDHGEVVRVVLNAVNVHKDSDNDKQLQNQESGNAQAAFSVLESLSKASADIIPSMKQDDDKQKEIMARIADFKTKAMKRMKMRLRQVSISQSAIQRVLSSVNVLRDALAQQSEDMGHLEHVLELPSSYRDFLSEIRRRRAYGSAVTSTSTAMIDRLATMRADEVKAREKFLKGTGRHLMPSFFEMFVPTLATQPPLFTPQFPSMVEMDTLPDVGDPDQDLTVVKKAIDKRDREGETLLASSTCMESGNNNTPVRGNISADVRGASDASSLTESLPHHHADKSDVDAIVDKPETLSNENITDDPGRKDESSFIVSADENSNNDIIMETENDDQSEANAKQKTLAYENAILRQALERMGAKSPRTYLEEAAQERKTIEQEPFVEKAKASNLEIELKKVRTELELQKAKLKQSNSALADIKREKEVGKICDKISHSSFKVGDVGLFMPTGRGSGGKRTYLAFHSNCPHRYLSTDSIDGSPDYVLGRIVYQEELVAGAVGTDANPHGLHVGTKFWILTVEVLKVP